MRGEIHTSACPLRRRTSPLVDKGLNPDHPRSLVLPHPCPRCHMSNKGCQTECWSERRLMVRRRWMMETLSPFHALWHRTYSLWLSSFRRFTRGTLTLFAFLLGSVTGASELEKFVGEVAIGVGHGGGCGGKNRTTGTRSWRMCSLPWERFHILGGGLQTFCYLL